MHSGWDAWRSHLRVSLLGFGHVNTVQDCVHLKVEDMVCFNNLTAFTNIFI